MAKVVGIVVASALAFLEVAADWDPRVPGPFVADKVIDVQLCASGRTKGWHVHVSAPAVTEPTTVPAMAFLPGFSASPSVYSSVFGHIASHGLSVIGLDIPVVRLAAEGIEGRAQDAEALLQCIVADGGKDFTARYRAAGGNANLTFDVVNQFGLLAHSIGGHTLFHIMDKMSCFNTKFIVAFDPVDGLDPFGFEKQYLLPLGTDPAQRLNFSTPLALVVSGLANDASGPKALHFPSCAPVERSGYHWYASLDSPKWLLNFTEFGHLDLLDDSFPRKATSIVCPSGAGASTVEGRAEYRAGLGGIVVSLAQAVLPAVPKAPHVQQASHLKWLRDGSAMAPLAVTATSDEGKAPVIGQCARHDSVASTLLV